MRLKEIKPGMSIRCHNFEQGEAVVKQLKAQGAVFLGPYSPNYTDEHCVVFFNSKNQYSFYKFFDATCDFSDLILPEFTAEEVVPILTEICNRYNENEDCEGCPLNGLEHIYNGNQCPFTFKDYKQVMKICAQWKSEHEKKEPEIETEWFWQGRIFQIYKDGGYCRIKDGTGFYDTGCEYRESAEEYMEDELKEYCKTHEGEFIAVVEHVLRVKAVE